LASLFLAIICEYFHDINIGNIFFFNLAEDINSGDDDSVIIATGILPRIPKIPGISHSSVMTYLDALHGKREIGKRVAIIGAGGIGIDMATWLCGEPNNFSSYWGIDLKVAHPGGVMAPQVPPIQREVTILQRKKSRIGAHLGKTTGWIHRLELKKWGVKSITSVEYQKIDDRGLHLMVNGQPCLLQVDSIILCAGQEERQDLYHQLQEKGLDVHLIGGAYKALELDAKQAIEQATRLGLLL
jgi:2,4-dienoyl-CoA reductase (NADPH2)